MKRRKNSYRDHDGRRLQKDRSGGKNNFQKEFLINYSLRIHWIETDTRSLSNVPLLIGLSDDDDGKKDFVGGEK